jgi:hypothetical protein
MRFPRREPFRVAGLSLMLTLVLTIPTATGVLAATIVCTGFPCNGTEQDDIIDASNLGGSSFDIAGLGGDDTMFGSDVGHHLDGGAGDDTIFGGASSDVLAGDKGDDKIVGDAGDDLCRRRLCLWRLRRRYSVWRRWA